MSLQRRLLLLSLLLLLGAIIAVAAAPLAISAGLRAWVAWSARQHGIDVELGEIEAPLLRPVVVRDLRLRSRPNAAFYVNVVAARAVLGLNLAAIFNQSRRRPLRSLSLENIRAEIRRNTYASAPEARFDWATFRRLIADDFTISGLDLRIEDAGARLRLEDAALSASELAAGIVTARTLEISSPWFQKTFSSLRGATSWQNDRLTLGAFAVARGLDIDAITINLSHLSEQRIGLEMNLDAFGGKLRVNVSSEERAHHRFWDVAGAASGISLSQMSDTLALTNRASGSLRGCKFTFRGEAANLAQATASVWAEVTGLTWRDRTADTIMLGAALFNRQIQIEQLYVKQRRNELTLSGQSTLPAALSDWLKPDFRGDISASLNDLGEFARLFGANASDFAGTLTVEGSVTARERRLGGQLGLTGSSLLLFRVPVESLRAKLALEGSQLEIEEVELLARDDFFRGGGTIDLAGDRAYAGRFSSSIANLADYADLLPDSWNAGQAGGSVSIDFSGMGHAVPSAPHTGTFHAEGRALRLWAAYLPVDGELEGDYSPDNIFFRTFQFTNPRAHFSAFVTAAKDYLQLQTLHFSLDGQPKVAGNLFLPISLHEAWTMGNWPRVLSDDPVFDLEVVIEPTDLSELAAALTGQMEISGQVGGRIELFGPAETLAGRGELHLRNFMFRDPARLTGDLEARLAAGALVLKANAIAGGSGPAKLEGSFPLRLEKTDTSHALNMAGPISATLDFPLLSLGKLPRYLSRGVEGIVRGKLMLSDSWQKPRIAGDLRLIEGKFAKGIEASARVAFAGNSAALEFLRLGTQGAALALRGEVDFRDLNAVVIKLLPTGPAVDLTVASPGSCLSKFRLSALAFPDDARKISELELRGGLSDSNWTISVAGAVAAQSPPAPDQDGRAVRTFRYCPAAGPHGETFSLGVPARPDRAKRGSR